MSYEGGWRQCPQRFIRGLLRLGLAAVLLLLLADVAAVPAYTAIVRRGLAREMQWGRNVQFPLRVGLAEHGGLLPDGHGAALRSLSAHDCATARALARQGTVPIFLFDIDGAEGVGLGDWMWQLAEGARAAAWHRGRLVIGRHPRDFDADLVSPFGWCMTTLAGCVTFEPEPAPVLGGPLPPGTDGGVRKNHRHPTNQSLLPLQSRYIESLMEFAATFGDAPSGKDESLTPAIWQVPRSFNSAYCGRYNSGGSSGEASMGKCFRKEPFDDIGVMRQYSATLNTLLGKPSRRLVAMATPWIHEMRAFDVRVGFKIRLGDIHMAGSGGGVVAEEETRAVAQRYFESRWHLIECAMRMASNAGRQPSVFVFVASDDAGAVDVLRDAWTEAYPDDNVTIKTTDGKAVHTETVTDGVSKRLLDLFLLSRTDFIVSGKKSMFSLAATAMMPNPSEVFGTGHCAMNLRQVVAAGGGITKKLPSWMVDAH